MLTNIRCLILLIILLVSSYTYSGDIALLDELDFAPSFSSDIEAQLEDGKIWKAYSSGGSSFWLLSKPQLIARELCRARLFYGEFRKEGPVINRPEYVRKVRYFYSHMKIEKVNLSSCSDIPPDSYFEVTSPIEEGTLNELSAFLSLESENIRTSIKFECSGCNSLSISTVGLPPFSSLFEKYMYRVVLKDRETNFTVVVQVKKLPSGYEVVSANKLNID